MATLSGYFLILFLTAFGIALLVTPMVRLAAVRLGAVDEPGERKIHRERIPRLGGAGVALSASITIAATMAVGSFNDALSIVDISRWKAVLLGAGMVFLVGVWDDVRRLPAWVKFVVQGSAAAVAMAFGVKIDHVTFWGAMPSDLGSIAIPLTFIWIVGITNAFNLIDGLDGLAAGLASIAAGTCAAIFLMRGDVGDAVLLVILLGALAGFIPYNFHPAKIFLGDSGSLVIGYILAVTSIMGSTARAATSMAVVVPLLVFGLPIIDTLLSMARRFITACRSMRRSDALQLGRFSAARHMFEADQSHIHHRLLNAGLSHRNAVLVMYGLAFGLSGLALLSVLSQFRNAGIILLSVGLATYIGIHKLGYDEVSFLRAGALVRWYDDLKFNRLFFSGFVDLILITLSYSLSFILKYGLQGEPQRLAWYVDAFPLVLLTQLGVFLVFGLYRGVWRATAIPDLLRVFFTVASGAAVSYIIVLIRTPPDGVTSFFCIDLLLLAVVVGGVRCVWRVLRYSRSEKSRASRGAVIYGAGRGGQLVLRELLENQDLGLLPLGFLDDDPRLRRRTVTQVPVLGSGADLLAILEKWNVTALIVSSEKIPANRISEMLSLCKMRNINLMRAKMKLEPLAPSENGCSNTGQDTLPSHPALRDERNRAAIS